MSTAGAPGKVILFGEHFVVHGGPAILAAIDRRASATARTTPVRDVIRIESDIGVSAKYFPAGMSPVKGGRKKVAAILDPIAAAVRSAGPPLDESGLRIKIESDIPYGVGLGSSAASCLVAVAAVDSLYGRHDRQWVCDRAVESERMIHKNSSGADCYVSTYGGIIRYGRKEGYSVLHAKKALNLLVCSTGIRHSTGDQVEKVRMFKASNEERFHGLALRAAEICNSAHSSIESGDYARIGTLMTENQKLLREIGVSHRKAERIIGEYVKAGALGAKITGAGGGGAVIAIASTPKGARDIAAQLKKKGYDCTQVQVDQEGLTTRQLTRS